ncbi:MAG: hypothetical protein Q8O72_07865, partial [Bacteroidales bacterium]|nr:hypothetical protein [Bacteroidales bacterium]
MKKVLKIIGITLLTTLLLFIGFTTFITFTDYKPLPVEVLKPFDSSHPEKPVSDTTFTIMTWNVGYAGLGDEMDFFYDGGENVRTSWEATTSHLRNIRRFLHDNDSIDFWLIQEVDAQAHRTYNLNELDSLKQDLPEFESTFATNYLVPFVPVPVTEPMGAVHAGMMTLSRFRATESIRYAYPLIASWPERLFLLDRCFIFNRYPLLNGHDLCVINTHNSAYVVDSMLRVEELQILRKVMLLEYQKILCLNPIYSFIIFIFIFLLLPSKKKATFNSLSWSLSTRWGVILHLFLLRFKKCRRKC